MSIDLTTITPETILPIITNVADKYLTRESSSHITQKGDANFVTEVDTNIEKAMKEQLSALLVRLFNPISIQNHYDKSFALSFRHQYKYFLR